MPDEAASAPATTTPSAPSAPASPPSAAPAAAATTTTTPAAPSAPAAKAETPGSPTGSKPQDVRTGLLDAAKTAVSKMRSAGKPSAQAPQGQATSGSAPPAGAVGTAAPQGTSPKTEGHDAASASPEKVADETHGATDPDADADAEDETKPPPFNEHPRWKKLTRDFEAATAQIKELQPDADQYRKITHYMQTFELGAEDVAEAYDILAKLKHHPQLAYEKLKPIMEELEARIGERLPEDLAKRVKEGYMDTASAKELAKARAMSQVATQQATRISDQQQKGQARELNAQVQTAVARWDAQQVSKNPDFIRLRPFVEDAAKAIMAKEGRARTPDAAIAVLDRAMKTVTERLQPLRAPVNGSTPKQPAAGTPSTAVAPPDPKSLREAMQLGLEGRYRVS